MPVTNSFTMRIGVGCVDRIGIKRGLALAQCLISLHPMTIVRQTCLLTRFGNPGVDVTATAVLGLLHIFDVH
jgi:hypothetical protein